MNIDFAEILALAGQWRSNAYAEARQALAIPDDFALARYADS